MIQTLTAIDTIMNLPSAKSIIINRPVTSREIIIFHNSIEEDHCDNEITKASTTLSISEYFM